VLLALVQNLKAGNPCPLTEEISLNGAGKSSGTGPRKVVEKARKDSR